MPAYQQIDPATRDLLNRMLDSDIIQLMFIALVLMMLFLLATTVLGYLKSRQEAKKALRDADNDDQIMNRILDQNERANINSEKANEATANLATAISALNETQRETRIIHQANRESILAQQEAVNTLVINVQNLGRQTLEWSKLMDGSMAAVRGELETLIREIQTLQQMVENPTFTDQIDAIVNGATKDILAKLDEILRRIPDPTTPPAADQQTPVSAKTDLDGAKHDATVDGERKQDAA